MSSSGWAAKQVNLVFWWMINDSSSWEEQRRPKDAPLVLTIQETGGFAKTVQRTVDLIKEMLPEANKVKREPIPVSEIMLGCECGGSDGYSGITANPALGIASDLLVAHGATSILAETPEIYGGEHLLTRRAISPEVGQKLVDLMHWWEEYTAKFEPRSITTHLLEIKGRSHHHL
ncbi:MAG: UxaA family hydrolase [Planctomycetaceae bacterium]